MCFGVHLTFIIPSSERLNIRMKFKHLSRNFFFPSYHDVKEFKCNISAQLILKDAPTETKKNMEIYNLYQLSISIMELCNILLAQSIQF